MIDKEKEKRWQQKILSRANTVVEREEKSYKKANPIFVRLEKMNIDEIEDKDEKKQLLAMLERYRNECARITDNAYRRTLKYFNLNPKRIMV